MLEDDTKFDRLVDGELTTDEYREMLTTLDEEPGGWRRCAMDVDSRLQERTTGNGSFHCGYWTSGEIACCTGIGPANDLSGRQAGDLGVR